MRYCNGPSDRDPDCVDKRLLPPPGPSNMIDRGAMPAYSPLVISIVSIVVLGMMALAWLQ